MPLENWNDDRLQALANEVIVLRTLPQAVAENSVRVDAHGRTLERHDRAIVALDERVDRLSESMRWTPALKAGIIVPTIASLIAAVAMVMTRGTV